MRRLGSGTLSCPASGVGTLAGAGRRPGNGIPGGSVPWLARSEPSCCCLRCRFVGLWSIDASDASASLSPSAVCCWAVSNWAWISEYKPFSERKSCNTVSGRTWELGETGSARRTGMPELVLMPAPVTTTTLRAFQSAFAISCNNGSQPGSTWVVGIVLRQSIEAALGEGGPRHRRTRQRTATKNKSASVYRVIVRAERW